MATVSEPYIHAHRSGNTIWIDMLFVPHGMRGRGIGRSTYEAWERQLPADVTLVLLMAADTGSGSSEGFWEAMGFGWRYAAELDGDLSYEDRQAMAKGVNGHPTPEPIWVDAEDEG